MQNQNPELRAAFIVYDDEDLVMFVELLLITIGENVPYIEYAHPYDIDPAQPIDLIMLGKLDHIQLLVEHYEQHSFYPPPILHFEYKRNINTFDYTEYFPDIDITPIPRIDPDAAGVTFKFDEFHAALERLRNAKSK